MSLASQAHAFWHASVAIARHRNDPVRLDIAVSLLRSIAKKSAHGKLRDMARERLACVTADSAQWPVWPGAAR